MEQENQKTRYQRAHELLESQLVRTIRYPNSGFSDEVRAAYNITAHVESLEIENRNKEDVKEYCQNLHKHYKDSRGMFGVNPLLFLHNYVAINNDGTIPINWNVSGFHSLTERDMEECNELFKLLRKEGLSVEHYDLNGCYRECIDTLTETIKSYKKGEKPTKISGRLRSVTEPYLQILAGGTPREGLTEFICQLSNPAFSEMFELPGEIIPQTLKDKSMSSLVITIPIGNFNILRQGRNLARKYFSLVDSILGDSVESLHAGLYREKDEKRSKLIEEYLDREWRRKDEAIEIAEETLDLFAKKAKHYQETTKR